MEGDEELLVELAGRGELHHHLPHTLQELRQNGRLFPGLPGKMAAPNCEFVSE